MKKLPMFVSVFAAASLFALNPITEEGAFLSDPAPRVGPDGKLWVFGSRDESPRHYCSRYNDAFATEDVRSWKVHLGILDGQNIANSSRILYAPDAVYHRGKWRLFFCMPGPYVEGLAESDSPTGPYTIKARLDFAKQIDPSVFVDDDGSVYYTWGQFAMKAAKLTDDLTGIVPGTLHENVIDEKGHNFHEGSMLLKRNGLYYLVYADIGRDHGTGKKHPTCIGYATSKNVFGPYTYRGVIVDNYGCDPKDWNNHGGIVEYKGKWYVFYHRTTNATTSMRKTCVEEISFDENGLIKEVETTCGGPAGALDPFRETPARIACVMSGNVRVVTSSDKKEMLGEIRSGDTATWRYFDFTRQPKELTLEVLPKDGGNLVVMTTDGCKLGEIMVAPGDGSVRKIQLPITGKATGKTGIRLEFGDCRTVDFGALKSFQFRTEVSPPSLVDEMVKIPGKNFLLGRTEVTQSQWMSLMGKNPSEFKGPDRPVENVSWNDIQGFLKKLNSLPSTMAAKLRFRLPLESEWEFACRAGGKGDWGRRKNGEEGPLDAMGWYENNTEHDYGTRPVAQLEPNAFGLYDMHGNVWEWCDDLFGATRVSRGGSWVLPAEYNVVGSRDWNYMSGRTSYMGFRLAASPIP